MIAIQMMRPSTKTTKYDTDDFEDAVKTKAIWVMLKVDDP